MKCLNFERAGSELEIEVNAHTQRVLVSVIKNDGNWVVKDYILDNCSVVTTETWKCAVNSGEKKIAPEYRFFTE